MLSEAEDLRGWLQKKGDKGIIKTYKSRYFQQIDTKLLYFEDPLDKEPIGSIDLTNCTIETQGQQLTGGFAFSINTPSRQWQLLADTQKDYDYWTKGLQDFLRVQNNPKDAIPKTAVYASGYGDPNRPRASLKANENEAKELRSKLEEADKAKALEKELKIKSEKIAELQKELNDMKEEVSNAKFESLSLMKKYEDEKNESEHAHLEIMASLQGQIEALNQQIRDRSPRGESDSVKEDNKRLLSELSTLRQQITVVSENGTKFQSENEILTKNIKELKEQLNSTSEQLKRIPEIEAKKEIIAKLESENAEKSSKLELSSKNLEASNSEVSKLQGQLQAAKATISELSNNNEEYQANLKSLKEENRIQAEKLQEIPAIQTEVQVRKENISKLEAEITEKNSKVESITKSLEASNLEVARLNALVQSKTEESGVLKQQIDSFSEISKRNAELELALTSERDKQVLSLESKIQSIEKENLEKISSLEKELQELKETLNNERESTSKELNKLKEDISSKEKANEQLQQNYSQVNSENSDLKEKFANESQNSYHIISKLKEENTKYIEEVNSLKEQLKIFQTENSEKIKSIEESPASRNEDQIGNQVLEEKINQLENTIKKITLEKDQSVSQLANIQKELEEVKLENESNKVKVAEAIKVNEDLNNAKEVLQKELDSVASSKDKDISSEEISKLKEELSNRELELQKLKDESQTQSNLLNKTLNEHKEKEEELNKQIEEHVKNEEALKLQLSESESSQQEISSLRSNEIELKQQLEVTKSENDSFKKKLQEEQEQSNTRSSELEARIASLVQKLEEHEHGSLKASEIGNQVLEEKINQLENTIKEITLEKDQSVSQLTKQNEELNLENKANEKLIEDLKSEKETQQKKIETLIASNSLSTKNFEKIAEELFNERSKYRGRENVQYVLLQSLEQEKSVLQEKIVFLEKSLKESNSKFDKIAEELFKEQSNARLAESIYAVEFENMRAKLGEKEEQIVALAASSKDKDISSEEINKLKEELSNRELELQKLKDELQTQSNLLNKTLNEHKEKEEELNKQIEEHVKNEEALKLQLSESESKLSSFQEQIVKRELSSEAEPRTVIEQAPQRSANDASLIEELLFEKQKLEDQTVALKAQNTQLEAEIEVLKSSSHDEELMETIRALNAKLKEEKDNNKLYAERIQNLTDSVQELTTKLSNSNSQENDIQNSVLSVENELQKKDIESLKEQLQHLQNNLSTKEEILSLVKTEKQQLEKQVEVEKEGAKINQQLAQDEVTVQKEQVRVLKQRMEAFQQEMVKKDILLTEQMKESLSNSKSKTTDVSVQRIITDLEKTKEKNSALQSHNAFLTTEIERLEAERKVRMQTIERLRKQVLDYRMQPGDLPLKELVENFEALKKKYFMSVAVSVKLQGQLLGWYANVDLSSLFEKAMNEDIQVESWPEWITEEVQRSRDLNTSNNSRNGSRK